jgi:hypothetical protein
LRDGFGDGIADICSPFALMNPQKVSYANWSFGIAGIMKQILFGSICTGPGQKMLHWQKVSPVSSKWDVRGQASHQVEVRDDCLLPRRRPLSKDINHQSSISHSVLDTSEALVVVCGCTEG